MCVHQTFYYSRIRTAVHLLSFYIISWTLKLAIAQNHKSIGSVRKQSRHPSGLLLPDRPAQTHAKVTFVSAFQMLADFWVWESAFHVWLAKSMGIAWYANPQEQGFDGSCKSPKTGIINPHLALQLKRSFMNHPLKKKKKDKDKKSNQKISSEVWIITLLLLKRPIMNWIILWKKKKEKNTVIKRSLPKFELSK